MKSYHSFRTSVRRCHVFGIATPFIFMMITLMSPVVVGLDVMAQSTSTEQAPQEPNVIRHPLDTSSSSLLAVTTDVSIWPFSHHDNNNNNNSSSHGNQTSDDSNNNSKDKVCNDATTCDRCNSYYTCHWCAHDSTCHARGSVYGCVIGSSCSHPKKPDLDPNDTATGCSSHTTCRECALSSSKLCHWCGHDNLCHAIGSVYGCITGVDCYDNPHCQRTTPEPITPHRHSHNHSRNDNDGTTDVPIDHRDIGILPLVLIVSLAGIMICCSTSCCCIMNCLKGAYDDLAIATLVPPPPTTSNSNSNPNRIITIDHNSDDLDVTADEHSPLLTSDDTIPSSTSQQPSGDDNFFDCPTSPDGEVPTASHQNGEGVISGDEATEPLLETTTAAAVAATQNEDCYARMVDGEETNDSLPTTTTVNHVPVNSHGDIATPYSFLHRTVTPGPRQHRRFVAMQRLYITCMGCYIGNILMVGFCTYLAIYYFPQKPIYNICNDSVAWNSLMESMISLKATAEFQILASVYNPNPLDVALDMGKGSFAHNGDMVGTYEIPPTLMASQAITDLLIVARFTPEKWQALSITAEYYSGNLVLHVNADASIRIPALFDYTISTSLQDIVVHVNALSDRHLCSCPTWANNNVSSYHPHRGIPVAL